MKYFLISEAETKNNISDSKNSGLIESTNIFENLHNETSEVEEPIRPTLTPPSTPNNQQNNKQH